MTWQRLTVVFVIAVILALPITAPLAAGLAAAGPSRLTATDVRGSIWGGELRQAALGPFTLGDVKAGMDPLSLLTGRPKARIEARGEALKGHGWVRLGRGAPGIEDFSASVPLSAFGVNAPLSGELTLTKVTAGFRAGVCAPASGEIAATLQGVGGAAIPLKGRPGCQGRALVLPLTGSRDGARVDLVFRLEASGRYQTEAKIQTSDPMLSAILAAEGFTCAAGECGKANEGRLS